MAKSIRRGTSIQIASDMEYDYICSPCEEDDLNAEAVIYCKQCCKQYCKVCEVHHRKIHKAHIVLNRDQVQSWGIVKKDDILEMCEEHDGERIKKYCGDHDAICCRMCISMGHRSCKVVKQIQEVAKGIHEKAEFQNLPTNITNTLTDLNEVKDAKEKNSKALLDSRKDFLTTIQQLKINVVQMFDDIEKRTIQELDNLLGDTDDTIQRDVQACTKLHDELQKLHGLIQDKGQKNENAGYIGYRKCADKMATAESMVKQDYTITFKENQDIKKYISSIKTFGQFVTNPNVVHVVAKSKDGNNGQVHGTKLTRIVNTSDSWSEATSSDNTRQTYRVNCSHNYDVSVNSDVYNSSINGICQLPNGNTVITDSTNKNVKLLDDRYTVKCHCGLPDAPWGACYIQGDSFAVPMSGKTVQFVNTKDGHLRLTSNIKFNHECREIVYHNDQLYVSCGTAIYIYTMSGQLVKKLYEDKSGDATVNYFTVNRNCSRIYITNYNNETLITLDNKGNKLATFKDPDLSKPSVICVADNNTVLVNGNGHTILQVDHEGQHKLSTVATQSDGVYFPKAMLVNRKSGELIVGQNRNYILVLKLVSICEMRTVKSFIV